MTNVTIPLLVLVICKAVIFGCHPGQDEVNETLVSFN